MQPVAVIMAGGSGERFWPVSRKERPKQLLKLTSNATMLEESVERAASLVGKDHVYIATSCALAPAIRDAVAKIAAANVLEEPEKRNTAGCLVLVAAILSARFPADRVVLSVLTADHAIGDAFNFRSTVGAAMRLAGAGKHLVTLGIKPTRPETGYGYIETRAEELHHDPAGDVPYFLGDFREKPNLAEAHRFLASEKCYWNSGMFFFRLDRFEAELKEHLPSHAATLAAMRDIARGLPSASAADLANALRPNFSQLYDVSIDVGLMEKSRNVAIVPATFPWDDVGDWSSLARYGQRDEFDNVKVGDCILVDCERTVAYNIASAPRVLTAVGLRDQLVAMTDQATLVVPLCQAQAVKQIVAELKKAGRTDLL